MSINRILYDSTVMNGITNYVQKNIVTNVPKTSKTYLLSSGSIYASGGVHYNTVDINTLGVTRTITPNGNGDTIYLIKSGIYAITAQIYADAPLPSPAYFNLEWIYNVSPPIPQYAAIIPLSVGFNTISVTLDITASLNEPLGLRIQTNSTTATPVTNLGSTFFSVVQIVDYSI